MLDIIFSISAIRKQTHKHTHTHRRHARASICLFAQLVILHIYASLTHIFTLFGYLVSPCVSTPRGRETGVKFGGGGAAAAAEHKIQKRSIRLLHTYILLYDLSVQ